MNINWDEKPDWADVWIEDKDVPTYSGWHKDVGGMFIDRNRLFYRKSKMDETKVIHYPPETKPNQVMAWQPIETAPKDGTIIDLWYPSEPQRVTNCRWYKKNKFWGTERTPTADYIESREENPTHWMIAVNPETKSEWNGEGIPPVGAEVSSPSGKGIVMLPPDIHGVLIIKASNESPGEYRRVAASVCAPIQSDKEKWIQKAKNCCDPDYEQIYDALISGELTIPEVRK